MSSDDTEPHKHHINITNVILDSFLATLLLLLTVSCFIVFRSFLIRRRVRTHVREALEAGLVVDEQGNIVGEQPRQNPLGDKPVIWEVWVDEKGSPAQQSQDVTHSKEHDSFSFEEKAHDGHWQGILPVSAKVLPTSTTPLYSSPNPSLISHSHSVQSRSGAHHHPSLPAITTPQAPEKLQVSVLISMPNPNRRFINGQGNANYAISSNGKENIDMEEEGEVPELLFGITEVGMRS